MASAFQFSASSNNMRLGSPLTTLQLSTLPSFRSFFAWNSSIRPNTIRSLFPFSKNQRITEGANRSIKVDLLGSMTVTKKYSTEESFLRRHASSMAASESGEPSTPIRILRFLFIEIFFGFAPHEPNKKPVSKPFVIRSQETGQRSRVRERPPQSNPPSRIWLYLIGPKQENLPCVD